MVDSAWQGLQNPVILMVDVKLRTGQCNGVVGVDFQDKAPNEAAAVLCLEKRVIRQSQVYCNKLDTVLGSRHKAAAMADNG